MKMRSVMTLMVVVCSMALASCEASVMPKGRDGGYNATAGTGGSQNGGGSSGSANPINPMPPCPSGLQCTAPAGEFVCTEAATLMPPLCVNQTDCSFGTCTQYDGQGYCTQPCGPAAVDECPSGSVCNLVGAAYVCTESILWSSPPCATQADCPFGECILSYDNQNYCIQPCRPTIVEQCPSGTACAPFAGKFYCVLPSTGLPDECSIQNDTCQYGKCMGFEETSYYCTQECEPNKVASCPNGTICRAIAPFGFLCSEPATAIPPVCQSQADCAFGTCIKSGDVSYCTEYCSQPVIDITGAIFGLNGAVAGVEVCIFENNSVNRNFCAITNSDGAFALYELPESTYFVLSMTKAGYQSNLQLALANTLTTSLMLTEEEISAAATALGVTYPASNTGLIVFVALDAMASPVSGFTAALTPQTGSGPFYAGADNLLNQSLTATSTTGWGAFFNLTPQYYALDFTHASTTCEDLPEVIVVSGYLTYVVTGCF
jgi:hypothetical protein